MTNFLEGVREDVLMIGQISLEEVQVIKRFMILKRKK